MGGELLARAAAGTAATGTSAAGWGRVAVSRGGVRPFSASARAAGAPRGQGQGKGVGKGKGEGKGAAAPPASPGSKAKAPSPGKGAAKGPAYNGRLPPQPKDDAYAGPPPNAVADFFYKATVGSLIALTLVYLWNFGSMGAQILLQHYEGKQVASKHVPAP